MIARGNDRSRTKVARAGIATLLAVVGSIVFNLTALADTSSGQMGDYVFTDNSAHAAMICTLKNSPAQQATFWLAKVTVKPPSLWWPDTSSDSNTQHGRVGWSFILQNDQGTNHWKTVYKSPVQRATAYEDSQDPYGSSTKAPLTKMSKTIRGKSYAANSVWRVIVRANWYRKNGGVLGYVKHTATWYAERLNVGGALSANVPCSNQEMLH